MNQAKGRRSRVKKNYYERQFKRTEANKARRAASRARRAARWK